MTDGTGTTSYGYDPYTELLTQVTYPDQRQMTIQYDENDRRTEMTGPFGLQTFYTYDVTNRLKTVGTEEVSPDAIYAYYKNGLLRTSSTQNGIVSTFKYDGQSLIELQQQQSEEVLNKYEYKYDGNKNITERNQNGKADSFTYDPLNRVETSSLYNEGYTYDTRGNRQTLKTDTEPQIQEAQYTYDDQNRLSQVINGKDTVNYQYNGDGLLVERTQNGETTRYYYDGHQIIAEAKVVDGKSEVTAQYERGQRLEAIVYGDSSKAYVTYNGHGDVMELRDAQGNILNQYSYDIWGNVISKKETVYNPFLYSGEL